MTQAPFADLFKAHADAAGAMSFARFMELALYHPGTGYYRKDRRRVGYGAGTDFFTASTSGPVFGELVSAACSSLLGGRNPRDYTFVEIGAERHGSEPAGILSGVTHPFAACRTIPVGEPIALTGPCVVFSNELFDAQPFHRYRFLDGAWRERGVAIDGGILKWVDMPVSEGSNLPRSAPEGWILDAPLAAAALARRIASQPWKGLFVAFDYGHSLNELLEEFPSGTARAYREHRQSNDLLAHPGDQDLTCHVCWDWLEDALVGKGFASPVVESQEAFFVKHAADLIAGATAAEATRMSQRKLSLLQLLHPAHLGQKFQVLHALRD